MSEPSFFEPSRRLTVGDVAALTGASLVDGRMAGIVIRRLASAADGGADALVYVEGARNASLLDEMIAAAVLCSERHAGGVPEGIAVLVSRRPHYDFATVGRLLFPASVRPEPVTGETGISPAAFVDPAAMLEDGVIVEAGAVIGADVAIGRGTVVAPGAVLGPHCRIGRDCYIGPGAALRHALLGDRVLISGGVQVGQDGFGYVGGPKGPEKMPQLARVVIQDDVEIGANTTIDRGALTDTVIGEGTKIDNLVQIGHNVRIGRCCLIAGHTGLSGSAVLGDGVMLGGRVGVADHVTIGAGAAVGAAGGVMVDIPPGERWGGFPAQPIREFFRGVAAMRKLTGQKKRDRRDG